MKSKKYLAWLTACNNLNQTFTVQSYLIEKLCDQFEKLYFINFLNFRIYSDYVKKGKFNYEINKKFKIPNNFEIFVPKTKKEFKGFMTGKELIAINGLGTVFSDLSVHIFLNKYKNRIKQVQLSNIGDIRRPHIIQKGHFWRSIIFKVFKFYSQRFTVLLSNLRLVPKMEIRFITNLDIIKNINKSFIKKNLFKLKFIINYDKTDEKEIINQKTISRKYNKTYCKNFGVCLFAWSNFCCNI